MAIPAVDNAEYPTPDEVLAQLLSDIRYGYERIGVPVNVSRGTELYMRYKPVADRISIAIQNNKMALADVSPLDATGDALVELAGIFGITKRPAAAAAGLVQVSVSGGGNVTIPSGFTITAPDGIQYATTQAFTVGNNGLVEVRAESTGEDTDQPSGVVMTWDSAAIGNLGQNATVDTGGIDGGADEDDEETLRRRLLQRLSFPEVGGNDAQVATFAEEASSAIEAAFAYPAVRGPASYDVAVTAAKGDRALSTANVALAANNILANMPGMADLNITTVSESQVDVVCYAVLPLPVNAGGAGGGWRDGTPWPSSLDGATNAQVTSIANLLTLSQITVNSTAADAPVAGRRFGIWNPTGGSAGYGEMHEFTVLTVGGAPGAYIITIDTNQSDAIGFIEVGFYISAGAINLKTYAAAFLAAVQALGPGQKSNNPDIIPRALRRPSPDVLWPTDLTTVTLKQVLQGNDELLDLSYAYRSASTPALPATTADPPRILTLHSFAIRASV